MKRDVALAVCIGGLVAIIPTVLQFSGVRLLGISGSTATARDFRLVSVGWDTILPVLLSWLAPTIGMILSRRAKGVRFPAVAIGSGALWGGVSAALFAFFDRITIGPFSAVLWLPYHTEALGPFWQAMSLLVFGGLLAGLLTAPLSLALDLWAAKSEGS